ncbi:MAG TPA: RNA 2',3'-cyclic phosphodiesterase [Schlesneria sp.]|jgi:2'-5' RNA ligase
MRIFIAVPIRPTDAISLALSQLRAMRPPLKVIQFDQLHLTTVFLGETDESLISDLGEVIHEVAGSVSLSQLTLRGIGAFPNDSRPTVVWAGFANPGPLIQLADQLATRCEQLGFVRETRPFQPHLTLARVKLHPPRDLTDFIHEHATTDFGTVRPLALTLYRSDLGSTGPVYTPLITANLASEP